MLDYVWKSIRRHAIGSRYPPKRHHTVEKVLTRRVFSVPGKLASSRRSKLSSKVEHSTVAPFHLYEADPGYQRLDSSAVQGE